MLVILDGNWEQSSGVHYDMGALFVLYFVEQLGDESLKVFQNINASGFNAFQQLLAYYNTGLTTESWFSNLVHCKLFK